MGEGGGAGIRKRQRGARNAVADGAEGGADQGVGDDKGGKGRRTGRDQGALGEGEGHRTKRKTRPESRKSFPRGRGAGEENPRTKTRRRTKGGARVRPCGKGVRVGG